MANLLLVDDDNDLVEALRDLLRAEEHVVHTASTGEEGQLVLRSASLPDALVLDVAMPVLGGPAWLTRCCCTTPERRTFRSSWCRGIMSYRRLPSEWGHRTSSPSLWHRPGGTMRIESFEEKGTRFVVELPRHSR